MYGKMPEWRDTFSDCNPDWLYCWEIVNTTLIEGAVLKDISLTRGGRNFVSEKVRIISKIINLIQKAKKIKDLDKIQNEKDKLLNVERKEIAHNQKLAQRILQLREKEKKEAEKLEKKRAAAIEK